MAPYRSPFAPWLAIAVAGLLYGLSARSARAQFPTNPYELSDKVQVDEADSEVRAHFERITAYVAEKQWDEAVETLRQVMETSGAKLIRLDAQRWVTIRDYCQMKIVALPAEGLALYRSRVDPLAKKWYEQAIAQRDPELLQSIVDQMFASSWGDDALYALGEMALERGDYAAVRGCWEQISPLLKTPDGRPLWLEPNSKAAPAAWLAYPDTDLKLADVRARLTLVSILEGDERRAKAELESFTKFDPKAKGRMGGREVVYAEFLAGLLESAAKWPAKPPSGDWLTFAGDSDRTRVLSGKVEIGKPAWEPIMFGPPRSADVANGIGNRVAEDRDELLSYHPVLTGDLVLFNDEQRIYAFNVHTGKPAWPVEAMDPNLKPGEIYRDETPEKNGGGLSRGLGVPRFTLSVQGNRLYARMGAPLTSRSPETRFPTSAGYMVCLNLAESGKLVWKVLPEDERWAFEGSPLCDGTNVFVAMRHDDVRPQAHVACFDAQTGALRWRRWICSAETPGQRVQLDEITHNLLTLDHDTLYLNTNLGMVAALSASGGQIRWLFQYLRAKREETSAHFFRDLNPCVYDRGLVFVMPTDSKPIYALDALTGREVWESALPYDAVHMLGVCAGNLVASGNRLWCFEAPTGKLVGLFPDSGQREGYGRGLMVDGRIYWPTRTKIKVFSSPLDPRTHKEALVMSQEFDLLNRGVVGAKGGNLLLTRDGLLIATGERLIGFSKQAGVAPPAKPDVTSAAPPRSTIRIEAAGAVSPPVRPAVQRTESGHVLQDRN